MFSIRLLVVALSTGLLSSNAAIAGVYDALCNDVDCQIAINESGFYGPKGFISKDKITQWYTGGDSYNLVLGALGGAAGGTAGLAIGTVACFSGIFCPVALGSAIFGGGQLGTKLGGPRNFFFTVMGEKEDGSNVSQSFRFINKKPVKKLQKELTQISGLKMGQVKSRNIFSGSLD